MAAPPQVAAQPALGAKAIAEPAKAAGAAVQAILDRIAGTPQAARAKGTAEMDQLRRMAEAVNDEIRTEDLIESVGAAADAAADGRYLEAVATPGDGPRAGTAARPNASPYAAQRQAYRENA